MNATNNNVSIVMNAVTTAVDTLVNHSLTFDAACITVRGFRASGKLDDKTARKYFQAALLAKVPKYEQDTTETGVPAPGSAFQKAITRLMSDTNPKSKGDTPKEEINVPGAIKAAAATLWALCAEYEAASKLCATAIANAKAGK